MMESDHDADLDEIVAMLTDAGLVTVETIEGRETYVLTAEGAQVGLALAMSGDETDALAVLDALLDDAQADTPSR